MTSQHPLDKLSAAVDGGLDHETREKVLSHLVGCDACRAEVDEQRRLKARMLGLDTPGPSEDLMQRLLGVPAFSTEPREEVRPVLTPAVSLSPQHSVFPAARTGQTRPSGQRPARTTTRRRTTVLGAAGSAAAVATLLGTAFVIGDPAREQQPPMLQPPVSSFSADYASTMSGYPFGDPAVLLTSLTGPAFANQGSVLLQPAASSGR